MRVFSGIAVAGGSLVLDPALAARVVKLNAFSAHADQDELVSWISHFNREQLQHLYILHGEYDQSEALAHALGGLGLNEVAIPERGEWAEV